METRILKGFKELEKWVNSDEGFDYYVHKNQEDTFSAYHVKYEIELSYKGLTIDFNYQCNPNYGEPTKKDCLSCLLIDSSLYDSCRDIDDFQGLTGIDKVSEVIRAYEGCKENSNQIHKLFTNEEIQMLDVIFEDY